MKDQIITIKELSFGLKFSTGFFENGTKDGVLNPVTSGKNGSDRFICDLYLLKGGESLFVRSFVFPLLPAEKASVESFFKLGENFIISDAIAHDEMLMTIIHRTIAVGVEESVLVKTDFKIKNKSEVLSLNIFQGQFPGEHFGFDFKNINEIEIKNPHMGSQPLIFNVKDFNQLLINGKLCLFGKKIDKTKYQITQEGQEFYDGIECHYKNIYPFLKSSFTPFEQEKPSDQKLVTKPSVMKNITLAEIDMLSRPSPLQLPKVDEQINLNLIGGWSALVLALCFVLLVLFRKRRKTS